MLKKKIFTTFIATVLILSFTLTVFADPISDARNNLENQEDQYKNIDDTIDSNQQDVEKIEQVVQSLNAEIAILTEKVSGAKASIVAKEKEISNTQKEIEKLIKDIEDKQALLDTRVRAMYINGNESYLSFLLDSKNLSDILARIEFVKKIVSFDKETIAELNNNRKTVEDKKIVLEAQKVNLVAVKVKLEKDKLEITNKKKVQQTALNTLNARRAELDAERAKYAEQIKNTKAKIEALIKAAEEAKKKNEPSRGYENGNGSDAVAFAYKYLGCPYVWGATGQVLTRSMLDWARGQGHYSPSQEKYVGASQAFDCSGLVVYTYSRFGVNLPRTTYYQVNVGQFVSRENLKSGDLIYYGSSRNVYHVAIYIGDGLIIEAPYTGANVRISNAFRSDYYIARRVIS